MSYDILSVHVPSQEVTGSTTDLDAQAVAKLDSETIGEKGHLNAWLHSHVNMGVFWSATDKETIYELGQQGLCVAVVVNKKREMRGAVYWKGYENKEDFYPGFPTEGFLDELPLEVVDKIEGRALWDKEYEDNVRKKVYAPTTGGNYTGKNTAHTTTTGGTYGVLTSEEQVLKYEKLIEDFKEELAKVCIYNANTGELVLSKRQKSRMKYLSEQLVKWENKYKQDQLAEIDNKQLALIKGDLADNAEKDPKYGTMYTDEELFHMTFTDLNNELKDFVKEGYIDSQENDYWIQQWRTCGVRLKKRLE